MVSLLAATAAQADTQMSEPQLDALLTGNTVYVATPGGEAPVFYGADGRAAANLPNGVELRGTWALKDGGYCVDWTNGPQNSCTRVVKSATGLAMFDQADDAPRGSVVRIVPGNAEDL
ncbi:hypothetical protein [uncultured Tateyamaria sp.]|nr:hypothetical protein [uncultured Tateyamaria sp.]